MPNGSRVNLYLPQGVLKVRSLELSSSTGSCQKPLHASNVENICAPVSLFATCSTVAIG